MKASHQPSQQSAIAVVVTHNRRALLEHCLRALGCQSHPPSQILVVDNASTDGTYEWLQTWLPVELPGARVVRSPDNGGGAGGFAQGVQWALGSGEGWIWLMDDDAEPQANALEALMREVDDPANIYGSLAAKGAETSWVTTLLGPPEREVDRVTEVPVKAEVRSLPFLGFLVHSSLVRKIGLPDAGYFIAADDVEYCVRARRAGAAIFVVGTSRIEHPRSRPRRHRVLGHSVTYLSLPPWKRYYDTRNRLLIARQYYGPRLWTQALPGTLIRLAVAIAVEPNKLAQLHAFLAGLADGLRGIKGKRHTCWRITG